MINQQIPFRMTRINFTPPFRHFTFLGSINGLVCLMDYASNNPRPVWICNPITRECVTLTEAKRDGGIEYETTRFGYVSSSNEYKIVSFCKSGETHLEVLIYTLGSGDGWRNLGEFNFASESLDLGNRIFFANETFYWLDDELEMIITFGLSEEKFGEQLSPPPFPSNDWYDFRIGVMDGLLVFVIENAEDGFDDIWLLKKMNHNHDEEEGAEHQSLGWNKEFRINDSYAIELLALTKSDGVFTHDRVYLDIYNRKTSTWKRLVKFNNFIGQVFPHKNTLISLKELGEEDTKVMKSAQIEEIKRREQQQEDAEPEYIYL